MTQPIDPAVLAQIMEAAKVAMRAEATKIPEGPPLREIWKTWLSLRAGGDVRECRVHARHVLTLEFEFDGRIGVKLCEIPVNRITLPMAKAWYSQLVRTPKRTPTGGPTSPSYRVRIQTSLQSAIAWAVESSPTLFPSGVHPLHNWPREDTSGRKRTGCFEDEVHLDEYCKYLPAWLRLIVRIATGAGCMRLSEVLYLEKPEIIWSSGRISLGEHRTKNGTARNFPVHPADLEELGAVAQTSPSPTHVFVKPNGRVWSRRYVQRLMKEAARKSGMRLGNNGEAPTFHYLRRTGATWSLLRNRKLGAAALTILREEGGWKTAQVAQGYQDMTESMLLEAARNVSVSVEEARREAMGEIRADVRANPIATTPRRRSSRRPG